MSTDWNIKCLDCDETHRFNDANHRDEEMAIMVEHAPAIAALKPLFSSMRHFGLLLIFEGYGRVDVDWFAEHAGHRLWPVSEYGDLMGQCHARVDCRCGSSQRCVHKAGHEGEHSADRTEVAPWT